MLVNDQVRPHPPPHGHTHSVLKAGYTQVQDIEQRVEPRDGEGEPPARHELLVYVFDDPEKANEKVPCTDRAQQVLYTISMVLLHVQCDHT